VKETGGGDELSKKKFLQIWESADAANKTNDTA
jgi:hypothetical protein